jgi:hypothetical protein
LHSRDATSRFGSAAGPFQRDRSGLINDHRPRMSF